MRHHPKYAARALELRNSRPVFIETVEYFWVDGITRFHALQITLLIGSLRIVSRIVHPRESFAGAISFCFVYNIAEEPSAYHFKRLVYLKRFPYGFNASQEMLKPTEGLHTGIASRLNAAFGQGYDQGCFVVPAD